MMPATCTEKIPASPVSREVRDLSLRVEIEVQGVRVAVDRDGDRVDAANDCGGRREQRRQDEHALFEASLKFYC